MTQPDFLHFVSAFQASLSEHIYGQQELLEIYLL